MIGDLPEADAAPPANMLFICKLNQVTTEEDLDTIFSRFGTITSCDIIKDFKTGALPPAELPHRRGSVLRLVERVPRALVPVRRACSDQVSV